jgi:hypothetical protein
MEHSKSTDVNPRSLIDDAHDAIRVQANYYSVNIDEGRAADPTSAHHRRNPTLPTGCRGHIGAPLIEATSRATAAFAPLAVGRRPLRTAAQGRVDLFGKFSTNGQYLRI